VLDIERVRAAGGKMSLDKISTAGELALGAFAEAYLGLVQDGPAALKPRQGPLESEADG
jgi:hypothetical protein